MWVFWLILMIACLVIEGMSVNMLTIWFAAGALLALLADFFGALFWLQLLIFFVASIALLLIFIMVFKPRLDRNGRKPVSTNADRIIGEEGLVTLAIDGLRGDGQIQVLGQIWSAIAEQRETSLPVDTKVLVLEIRGVKAVVRPL